MVAFRSAWAGEGGGAYLPSRKILWPLKHLIVENAPHQHFKNWPAWLTKEPHTIEDVLENKDTVDQLKKWLDK